MAKTPKVASTRLSLPLGVAGTEPDADPEGSLAYATDTGRVRVKQAGGWADVSGGGGAPTGPAGGDLGGTYPNPTVTQARGLVTATTTVAVSAATAPSSGQVLTATSSTAATWQTPSASGVTTVAAGTGISVANPTGPTATVGVNYGTSSTTACVGNDSRLSDSRTPNGSAGGDLAGTYPNPNVAAIHETSGPTQLTFGSITAGQLLVRSGTTVIGQTGAAPTGTAGGDLSGTYPNPSVTTSAALKSATTNVVTSAATAPTSGQALVATSSTAATWQTLSATYSLRDPIWDPPTTASADDEECTTDFLAAGTGGWKLALNGSLGTAMTRDGAIDLTQAITSGHYRSSCIGSTLFIQLRQNEGCLMWKQVAAALTTQQLWFIGMGVQYETGTANTNDSQVSIQLLKDNGSGNPDFNNRAFIVTGTNADRYFVQTVTAGVAGPAQTTNAFQFGFLDGYALRINHGSSAAGNVSGFGFTRAGSLLTVETADSVQFNASSTKIAIGMQANTSQPVVSGVNAALFSFHFLRRVPMAGGWLAQS